MRLLDKILGRGQVHGPDQPHKWEAIRRGFPQRVCRCGALHAPGGVRSGENSLTVSPAGAGDILRWSGSAPALALGDLGMSVVTGRPSGFVGGVDAPLALLSEVAPSAGSLVATAVFTGGDTTPGGAMADVPDGAGFVEIVYAVPILGNYFFDADGIANFGGTFPSDGGTRWSCSVNTVDQGFLIEGPYMYIVSSSSGARASMRCRMPLTLAAGANTVRLRYQITGGLPSASLYKTASSPVTVALVKRP